MKKHKTNGNKKEIENEKMKKVSDSDNSDLEIKESDEEIFT